MAGEFLGNPFPEPSEQDQIDAEVIVTQMAIDGQPSENTPDDQVAIIAQDLAANPKPNSQGGTA